MNSRAGTPISEPAFRGGVLGFMVLIAALLITWMSYQASYSAAENGLKESVLRTTTTVAALIDGDLVASFEGPDADQREDYIALRATLKKLLASTNIFAFTYITRRDPLGRYYFIADPSEPPTDPNEEDLSVKYGEVYTDAEENTSFIEAWRSGAPTISDEPYTDQWGTFISTSAPIRNAQGEIVAFFHIDMNAHVFTKHIEPITRALLRGIVASIAIGLLAGFITYLSYRTPSLAGK